MVTIDDRVVVMVTVVLKVLDTVLDTVLDNVLDTVVDTELDTVVDTELDIVFALQSTSIDDPPLHGVITIVPFGQGGQGKHAQFANPQLTMHLL